MKPRVEIYPEKNYKGDAKFYSEGTYEIKESFTQNELVGKTFFIISSKLGSGGKKYAVDNGGCTGQKCYYHLYEWSKTNINQVFTMLTNGVIKSVGNGLVMDIQDGKFQNGQRIWNYPQNNTAAQLWEYDSNTKNLKVKGKNFVLSIDSDKMENKSKLWIWTPNGNTAHQWDIQLCDVKDNFMARERFTLRFYDPVPSFDSLNKGSKTEKFTNRFYDPVPSFDSLNKESKTEKFTNRFYDPVPFINDLYKPKSLEEQKESFNTHQAELYGDGNANGYKSGWCDIGDYNDYGVGKDVTSLNGGDSRIGEFTKWVGKTFYILVKKYPNFAADTRGTQNNGVGSDSKRIGIWTKLNINDASICNQLWTVDKFGHLSPVCNKNYVLSATQGSDNNSFPRLENNSTGKYDGQRWKLSSEGYISHLGGTPIWHVSGAKFANGTPIGHWNTKVNQDNTVFTLEEVSNVTSVALKPFTDIIMFSELNYKGNVLHLHNGKSSNWIVNLNDKKYKFDNLCKSYKIRAGAIDDKQSYDNNDTSGNSMCNIRYKVHMASTGWTGWTENGKEAGKIGNRMEAIMFEYSGPGAMLEPSSAV